MKREKSLGWYAARPSPSRIHLIAQNLADGRSYNIKTSSKSERSNFFEYAAATQILRWLPLWAQMVLSILIARI
jgi:hypothetical protein